ERADIVITSTGAPHFIITKSMVERLIHQRKNKPVFFIDIAVPRDIDPAVNNIDNVFLYDVDDLQQVVDANMQERMKEAGRAEEIVDTEVSAFCAKMKAREVAPLIAQIRETCETARREVIERNRNVLRDSTPQEAVDQITQAFMNKILHHPVS